MSNTNTSINTGTCAASADELALYAINDSVLYHTKTQPYLAALQRRVRNGQFDAERSIPGWKTIATAAAKKYCADYCAGNTDPLALFNIPTRAVTAQILADHYADHLTGAKQ